MYTERVFLPLRSRVERRVARRREAGLCFSSMGCSGWWGPLCQVLVFERRQQKRPLAHEMIEGSVETVGAAIHGH